MPANFVLLEKITVGAAGASSVSFSSIPQTGYTDLVLKVSGRSSGDNAFTTWRDVRIQFNSSTTGYSARLLSGNGSSAGSDTMGTETGIIFGAAIPDSATTANTFSNAEIYIPNYTSSANKSISIDGVTENNATQAIAGLAAGLWSNSAAISTITLTPTADAFAAGSTFYLYGVAKLGTTPAIVPYATGGDTIMTDGTYWYHTFLSSGTFTPQKSLSADYLVVAGGGSGGWSGPGGGGAGGLRSTVTATGGGGSLETPLSLGTSAYTVTIGAGGAGGANTAANGSNSVFSTITSTGGGKGAGNGSGTTGTSGGSGGGATETSTTNWGAGTTGQGYRGGNNNGGGGGAGAVGETGYGAGGTQSGAGGAGVATSISGTSVTYAGGGGGYARSGGGGALTASGGAGGGANTTANGTANRGGGGGADGGSGGSGIVIIRYAV